MLPDQQRRLMEAGTVRAFSASKGGMDDIERAAIAAEGYDSDDPTVVAALARVSAVLAAVVGGRKNARHGVD
jgi:hypothetical protein